MVAGQPSRTLLGAAIRRAEHQVLDTPLILEDPVILDLVPEVTDAAAISEFQSLGEPVLTLLRSLLPCAAVLPRIDWRKRRGGEFFNT